MNWPLISSLLGVCSVPVSVIIAFAMRQKIKAEALKTGADASAVLTGSALEMVKEARDDLKEVRAELADVLDAINTYTETVQNLLRQEAPHVSIPPFRYPTLKVAGRGGS